MKFIDEYRQGDLAQKLAEQIAALTDRPLKFMEVCGGHTHTIFKYGIEDLLPPNIEMIHGPGCPVCVIPLGRVDDAMSIAQRPEVRTRIAHKSVWREGFGRRRANGLFPA